MICMKRNGDFSESNIAGALFFPIDARVLCILILTPEQKQENCIFDFTIFHTNFLNQTVCLLTTYKNYLKFN